MPKLFGTLESISYNNSLIGYRFESVGLCHCTGKERASNFRTKTKTEQNKNQNNAKISKTKTINKKKPNGIEMSKTQFVMFGTWYLVTSVPKTPPEYR